MTFQPSATYRKRPIRYLETFEKDGWRLKVYGISASTDRPSEDLVNAIKAEAAKTLPFPAVAESRYGVGFLYAHQGRDGGGFASVNWWGNENELFHRQYEAPADSVSDLRPVEETGGSAGCVWDLAVIEHERRAWVECVLANDGGTDLDAYMARTFDAEV